MGASSTCGNCTQVTQLINGVQKPVPKLPPTPPCICSRAWGPTSWISPSLPQPPAGDPIRCECSLVFPLRKGQSREVSRSGGCPGCRPREAHMVMWSGSAKAAPGRTGNSVPRPQTGFAANNWVSKWPWAENRFLSPGKGRAIFLQQVFNILQGLEMLPAWYPLCRQGAEPHPQVSVTQSGGATSANLDLLIK